MINENRGHAPIWTRTWLRAAGVYNLAWGTLIILFPNWFFDVFNMPRTNYPGIWQCVGMIVGVYGIGYWIAANDSRRHWPIVLVGLLGKLLGPIGFVDSAIRGVLPWQFGIINIFNDLIWWIPFTLILWDAFMHRSLPQVERLKLITFVKESRIAASPEAVFRFHERPEALSLLTPPWAPMRVLQAPASLAAGTEVILSGRVLGLPMVWRAEHVEHDPPRLFADRQVQGPFDAWLHRHRFQDDGQGGAVLHDEVQYAVPFGWWGRLLLGGKAKREIQKLFDYRHEVTKRQMEAGSEAK